MYLKTCISVHSFCNSAHILGVRHIVMYDLCQTFNMNIFYVPIYINTGYRPCLYLYLFISTRTDSDTLTLNVSKYLCILHTSVTKYLKQILQFFRPVYLWLYPNFFLIPLPTLYVYTYICMYFGCKESKNRCLDIRQIFQVRWLRKLARLCARDKFRDPVTFRALFWLRTRCRLSFVVSILIYGGFTTNAVIKHAFCVLLLPWQGSLDRNMSDCNKDKCVYTTWTWNLLLGWFKFPLVRCHISNLIIILQVSIELKSIYRYCLLF